MSARLQRASRQTLTKGSFSGYSLIMDTSLGITPFWTNWSCWYAGWGEEGLGGLGCQQKVEVIKDKVTDIGTLLYNFLVCF